MGMIITSPPAIFFVANYFYLLIILQIPCICHITKQTVTHKGTWTYCICATILFIRRFSHRYKGEYHTEPGYKTFYLMTIEKQYQVLYQS